MSQYNYSALNEQRPGPKSDANVNYQRPTYIHMFLLKETQKLSISNFRNSEPNPEPKNHIHATDNPHLGPYYTIPNSKLNLRHPEP